MFRPSAAKAAADSAPAASIALPPINNSRRVRLVIRNVSLLPLAHFFINDNFRVTDWFRSSNTDQPERTSLLPMIQAVLNAFLGWRRHNRPLVSQFTNPERQF